MVDWHKRYLQQASWTRDLRAYLLAKAGIAHAQRILEVGCGTGAILQDAARSADFRRRTACTLHGVDIARLALLQSRLHEPSAHLVQGDALALPYSNQVFDVSYCHFLLLWVGDPRQVLREMKRVTRSPGHVLAFAEPDYSARVDHPADFASLGKMQERSLQQQGADTAIGSRLAELFHDTGMVIVETGSMDAWNSGALTEDALAGEWTVLREDLRGMLPESELDRVMQLDLQARARGERVLHVPVYFAHAQV